VDEGSLQRQRRLGEGTVGSGWLRSGADSRETRVCYEYRDFGRCEYGDRCQFSHDVRSRRSDSRGREESRGGRDEERRRSSSQGDEERGSGYKRERSRRREYSRSVDRSGGSGSESDSGGRALTAKRQDTPKKVVKRAAGDGKGRRS
jgi:hypothetical protein